MTREQFSRFNTWGGMKSGFGKMAVLWRLAWAPMEPSSGGAENISDGAQASLAHVPKVGVGYFISTPNLDLLASLAAAFQCEATSPVGGGRGVSSHSEDRGDGVDTRGGGG